MKIGIGIDAGGTYTDAVIYDFTTEKILASAKALTTKEDLSVGILHALDALPSDLAQQAEHVSLSTTLATNACVENKVGNAKLIMLGIEAKTVDESGGKYGLPNSQEIYFQDSYTKFSGEIEREPDWDLYRENIKSGFDGLDSVGIVEVNGIKNGGVIEQKAKEILLESFDYPVICAHELFGEINVLQRGASTLLNAQLVPAIHNFLTAIKSALVKRDINASVSIVRSDGSLMSEKVARVRPVETLLSGPAASVTGSLALRDEQNYIMVDMGGTTSDISIVKNRKPVKATDGINIGKWKTFVDGIYIRTVGLGGDTCVHYNLDGVYLEEYRVEPLCAGAKRFPEILENLKKLKVTKRRLTSYPYEHYYLMKDIQHNPSYSDEEKNLCAAFNSTPLRFVDFADNIRRYRVSDSQVTRLINEEIIQVIGLTPTDIMHLKGDLDKHDTEASTLVATFVAAELGITVEELCDTIYYKVKERLFKNIVISTFENKHGMSKLEGLEQVIDSSLSESYKETFSDEENALAQLKLHTDFPLVGVGAPIHLFLPDVAHAFGTSAILAENHEVANALGAIKSNINATSIVEVSPTDKESVRQGFNVFGQNGSTFFQAIEDAEQYAITLAEEEAKESALLRGAHGDITVKSTLERREHKGDRVQIFLESIACAEASGSILL